MSKEHQEERCGRRRSARFEPIRKRNGFDAKAEAVDWGRGRDFRRQTPSKPPGSIARVRRKAGVLQLDGRLGSGPIDPKDEMLRQRQWLTEGMRASVVAGSGCDASPKPGEHVLDLVALSVEDRI